MAIMIGFIGLGIMGRPMASHLLAAGYEVTTSLHHKAPPDDLVAAGLRSVADPRALASASDVVITMLPDTPQVAEVLTGASGLISGLQPGSLVIDMSTIDPGETQRFSSLVANAGSDYLDAPVSGGEAGAKQARLSIMVGGTSLGFARAEPILRCLGKTIVHIGESGQGQIAKIANQIAVALTIGAVSEALLFAERAGAPLEKVREAMLAGLAQSRILDTHGERMIRRDFAPGFRIAFHRKDLNLALQTASNLGLKLPGTAATQALFEQCRNTATDALDHSALLLALEDLALQHPQQV